MRWVLPGFVVLICLMVGTGQADAQRSGVIGRAAAKPYFVDCSAEADEPDASCIVDRATYVGWRAYHMVCSQCHAQDALGSSFAPSLVERVRQLDKREFLSLMENGYAGLQGVVPPWGRNRDVNRYYDELWSYLLARANGDLRLGEPRQQPASD